MPPVAHAKSQIISTTAVPRGTPVGPRPIQSADDVILARYARNQRLALTGVVPLVSLRRV